MRSFAVIAGFAAAANALVATPYESEAAYYESSTEAAYYESSTEAAYYASSTEAAYYASSTEAAYYASSTEAAYYAASSSAPVYDSYSTKVPSYETPVGYSTTVISKYETDCPEPTTITWNQKTYTVTKSTKLIINEPVTTTVPVYAPAKSSSVASGSASKPYVPAVSSSKPAVPAWSSKAMSGTGSHGASSVPAVPYYPVPSNGTSYTPPKATGTGAPSSTKPTLPESTGAAAQMGVGMLAVIGAVAAFL